MQEKKVGIAKSLGTRLREWRKGSGYKIAQMAQIIDISQGSLSDLENNKSLPSADTLAKLFRYTDIDIIWLLLNRGNMRRAKSGPDAHSMLYEDVEQYNRSIKVQDQTLKDLIDILIRVYHNGGPDKVAHLKGFLLGADPGM